MVLEDKAKTTRFRRRLAPWPSQFGTVKEDDTGLQRLEPGDDAQQGALAAA